MATDDTKATLLLCARLSPRGETDLKPLQPREYAAFSIWLSQRELEPGDLLRPRGRAHLADLNSVGVLPDRVEALLGRGAALGVLLEQWESRGLWVISRSDSDYPSRYQTYLQKEAPPVLYGVGDQKALCGGGVAVVGSRDASDEDVECARQLGKRCAAQHLSVISGAAKGIDSETMMASLEAGGRAVGVLAEGLGRLSVAPQYHDAIISGRLTMISAFEPDSHWFAFKAMGRNKMIYALADAAVVVSSSDESGGTWAGAVEALKAGRIPLFVKSTGVVSKGNEKLIKAGAHPLLADDLYDLGRLMTNSAHDRNLFQ